jgi:hypothetical protein
VSRGRVAFAVTRLHVPGLSAELSADPEVNAARRRFWHHRFEVSAPIITDAIERGDLPAHVDPARGARNPFRPCVFPAVGR